MREADDPLFPWATSGLLIRDSVAQMTPSLIQLPPLLQMPNKANVLEADHPAWIFEVTFTSILTGTPHPRSRLRKYLQI